MEETAFSSNFNVEEKKVKNFTNLFDDTSWIATATKHKIDNIFVDAIELQNYFSEKEASKFILKTKENHPCFNFKKAVTSLLEFLIKNQSLNESLTLYAIIKFIDFCSEKEFCTVLEDMLVELRLREYLFQINEELPDVDLDLYKINAFIDNILRTDCPNNKICDALKNETSVLLNAIKHGPTLKCHDMVNKIIDCLESQEDLRLWFILLAENHIGIFLDLCTVYNNLFQAVLKFFDKFANEVESNYDEDLNVKYCHLNLDFDEFVNILKLFLEKECIRTELNEYLDRKMTMNEKNFCFWIDVKACI